MYGNHWITWGKVSTRFKISCKKNKNFIIVANMLLLTLSTCGCISSTVSELSPNGELFSDEEFEDLLATATMSAEGIDTSTESNSQGFTGVWTRDPAQKSDIHQPVESSPVEKLLSEVTSEIEKLNEDFTLTIEGLTQADIKSVDFLEYFPELREAYWNGTFYSDYAVIKISLKISMEHKILSAYRSGNIESLSTEEQQVLDVALNVINSKISENASDYEKQLIVHDYIVANCVYDSVNYDNDTIPNTSRTSYGALVLGVAICQGYSSAFKLLMDMLGIECDIITGLANGESHAWNRVKIDGDYYLVDVTWDDPILNENSNREVYYDFFNLTDEVMNASHTSSEPQIKVANSTKYNYFYHNNLVVSSKSDFLAILQDALNKDQNCVYVLYENIDLREFAEGQDIFQYLGGKSKISYSFSDQVNTLYLQLE